MSDHWPTYDGQPIAQRTTPPSGTKCAWCGHTIKYQAMSREGKAWYHTGLDGECYQRARKAGRGGA